MDNRRRPSCYDILQVRPTATDEEIKRAYRALALQFHPDRNPRNRRIAELQFKLINEAYNRLKTPAARTSYNRALRKTLQAARANDNGASAPRSYKFMKACLRWLFPAPAPASNSRRTRR